MNVLITGVAGFIGYHVTQKLTKMGVTVDGIDWLGNNKHQQLKQKRLKNLMTLKNFNFIDLDIVNVNQYLPKKKYSCILHLAAYAGVRDSQKETTQYLINNIVGHNEILKYAADNSEKMIYASSSSVYGEHRKAFSSESDLTDVPTSIYGITKKTCEMISENSFSLNSFPQIGLRFFTVYGEYGRPDMAYWIFTKNILQNKEIELFNNGELVRDFTYIDDIVDGIINSIQLKNFNKHEILNLGNGKPRKTIELVRIIETKLNKKAIIISKPKLPTDVSLTASSNLRASQLLNFNPKISLETGIENFIDWYLKVKEEI